MKLYSNLHNQRQINKSRWKIKYFEHTLHKYVLSELQFIMGYGGEAQGFAFCKLLENEVFSTSENDDGPIDLSAYRRS